MGSSRRVPGRLAGGPHDRLLRERPLEAPRRAVGADHRQRAARRRGDGGHVRAPVPRREGAVLRRRQRVPRRLDRAGSLACPRAPTASTSATSSSSPTSLAAAGITDRRQFSAFYWNQQLNTALGPRDRRRSSRRRPAASCSGSRTRPSPRRACPAARPRPDARRRRIETPRSVTGASGDRGIEDYSAFLALVVFAAAVSAVPSDAALAVVVALALVAVVFEAAAFVVDLAGALVVFGAGGAVDAVALGRGRRSGLGAGRLRERGAGLAGGGLGALRLRRLAGGDAGLGGLRRGGLATCSSRRGRATTALPPTAALTLRVRRDLRRAAAFGWIAPAFAARSRAEMASASVAAMSLPSVCVWATVTALATSVFAADRRGCRIACRRSAWRTRFSPDGVRAPCHFRGVLAKVADLRFGVGCGV